MAQQKHNVNARVKTPRIPYAWESPSVRSTSESRNFKMVDVHSNDNAQVDIDSMLKACDRANLGKGSSPMSSPTTNIGNRANLGKGSSTMSSPTTNIGVKSNNLDSEQQTEVSKETEKEKGMALSSWVGGPGYVFYKRLIQVLETNKNFKKSYRGIVKQTTLGAGGIIIGGVFGGPLGAAVGGIVGSVLGYIVSDDYSPMIKVIQNLSESEQQRLVEEVQKLIEGTAVDALNRFIEPGENCVLLLQRVQSVLQKL